MGYLLPALTEAKFSNQRDVVLNERRQNYENRPYGLAPMAMLAALFPPDHPYHWTTIGEIADLHAVQLDDVHAFFRALLPPGERVAGARRRHRSATARWRWSTRLLRRDRRRRAASTPVARDGDARRATCAFMLEDRVELPRLYIAWLSPAMFAEGDAELDLAADICSPTARRRGSIGGWCSTSGSPPTCRPSQNSREMAGFVQIAATAAPGHTLAELERAILEEIARLAADGPTDDEIERGRVQAEAQFMFRLQTVGGFGGKSDQLNAYNVFLERSRLTSTRDLARYQAVTTRVAAGRGRRATRSGAPRDAEHRAARARRRSRCPIRRRRWCRERADDTRRSIARSCPSRGRRGRSRSRRSRNRRSPTACACGPCATPQVPVVTFMLLVRRGAADDPPGKDGLAALTADMLDEGSGDRSAIEMHEALARLGAQLDTDIGSDATVVSVTVAEPLRRPRARAARRHRRAAGADAKPTSRASGSCGCTG